MIVYRVEKYSGFYQGKHDDKPKDHFLYLSGTGEWTPYIQEACQFTSWLSANQNSKFLTNSVITQSNTNPKNYPDYDGDKPKKVKEPKSATLAAREAAEKLKKNKDGVKKSEGTHSITKKDGPSTSDQIRDLAKSGMAVKDISHELNVKYQFVYQVVKKMETTVSAV